MWVVGQSYEDYVGRWSRLVATEFVAWLEVPAGMRWLDVGCGTGALTRTVLERADPAEVVGVDPSDGFVGHARQSVSDPRLRFDAGDALALPYPADRFDVVVSGLVLNFVPDPAAAVAELRRVAGPGATVAAYVWDYADRMAMIKHFWTAAAELDPAAADLDEGVRFPLCRPDPLRALWTGAGLSAVRVEPIEVTARFRDFDDYWQPFLGAQGPAPAYLATLTEEHRDSLRESLRAALPTGRDDSIALPARAWAVRGE